MGPVNHRPKRIGPVAVGGLVRVERRPVQTGPPGGLQVVPPRDTRVVLSQGCPELGRAVGPPGPGVPVVPLPQRDTRCGAAAGVVGQEALRLGDRPLELRIRVIAAIVIPDRTGIVTRPFGNQTTLPIVRIRTLLPSWRR